MRPLLLAALLAPFAPAAPAGAQTVLGDLRIDAPMLRETPPNAPVAGGFLTIENVGDADDELVSATIAAGVAEQVQLHEMVMADGVMRMDEVAGGIVVPAGGTVALAPGGLHLMVMGLDRGLSAGETHAITLGFARAGEVTLDFPVRTLADIRAAEAAQGSGMGHSMDGMDPATHGAAPDGESE